MKGRETLFLKKCLEKSGRPVLVVDAGHFEPDGIVPDISRFEVAAAAGADLGAVLDLPRDQVISTMGRGTGEIVRLLCVEGRLEGVLALGGNQGTAIVCAAMRKLDFGFPKMVISTIGSGNMRPYIGASDIAVLFSVADLHGGPNPVVEHVLRNAAAAMVGMTARSEEPLAAGAKPLVAITALGNTHPTVSRAVELLRNAGMDVAVFHACRASGSAMEQLIAAGKVAAVLELTPHELTEEVVGAGWYQPVEAGRLTASGKSGIPQVIAPGSLEYLCFSPQNSIPPRFRIPGPFDEQILAEVRKKPKHYREV